MILKDFIDSRKITWLGFSELLTSGLRIGGLESTPRHIVLNRNTMEFGIIKRIVRFRNIKILRQ
ncbi:hypothetical protein HZS_259 [Henneguya salminicola]|nr:hypothetical protein HZS_259 [Henneguya salminicola]